MGGNFSKVFTAGTHGGCEPGLSADGGLWKEEGRGPGCLNSWGGSGAATPFSLSPPQLPGSSSDAPSYLGSCLPNSQLLEICGWKEFSALKEIVEGKCSVFSPKGLVGGMCRHTG